MQQCRKKSIRFSKSRTDRKDACIEIACIQKCKPVEQCQIKGMHSSCFSLSLLNSRIAFIKGRQVEVTNC